MTDRCWFLAGDCRVGACGRTGDDTGRGIFEPRAAAGEVSPGEFSKKILCYHVSQLNKFDFKEKVNKTHMCRFRRTSNFIATASALYTNNCVAEVKILIILGYKQS